MAKPRLSVTALIAAIVISSGSISYLTSHQDQIYLSLHTDLSHHRHLSLLFNNNDLNQYRDPKSVAIRKEYDFENSPNNPNDSAAAPQTSLTSFYYPPNLNPLRPYSVDNALLAIKAFRYQAFYFVYDAQSDEFVVIHNMRICDHGCVRIFRIAPMIAFALRLNFPERFQGLQQQQQHDNIDANKEKYPNDGSSDFVFVVSTGDIPRLRQPCLLKENHCQAEKFAPILQFGSVYSDESFFPSMIAMPQPVRPHTPCFEEWHREGTICKDLQPIAMTPPENADNSDSGSSLNFKDGLVFGNELGLSWDQLIPQIIWRGTNFAFLHTMFPNMRPPKVDVDIEPKLDRFGRNIRGAINALWDMGDDVLLPRWRGVLLTSEAELEVQMAEMNGGGNDTRSLPWVNIKFTSCGVDNVKTPTSQIEEYQRFEQLGIRAIGERMSMVDQAKYKYHIDLGGGGGTTWTGTIEKLALPGLLFHHVTPSKDWFHDMLKPWVHYVPVKTDLSDLREMYEWAESHPNQAKEIADNGTKFARMMGTPEGFSMLYNNHVKAPLQRVIDAYQPKGGQVLSILGEQGGDELGVVARCTGRKGEPCIRLDGVDNAISQK